MVWLIKEELVLIVPWKYEATPKLSLSCACEIIFQKVYHGEQTKVKHLKMNFLLLTDYCLRYFFKTI